MTFATLLTSFATQEWHIRYARTNVCIMAYHKLKPGEQRRDYQINLRWKAGKVPLIKAAASEMGMSLGVFVRWCVWQYVKHLDDETEESD